MDSDRRSHRQTGSWWWWQRCSCVQAMRARALWHIIGWGGSVGLTYARLFRGLSSCPHRFNLHTRACWSVSLRAAERGGRRSEARQRGWGTEGREAQILPFPSPLHPSLCRPSNPS